MSKYQHCIRSCFPQLLALSYHYVLVLEEFVLREFLLLEGVCGIWGEDGG